MFALVAVALAASPVLVQDEHSHLSMEIPAATSPCRAFPPDLDAPGCADYKPDQLSAVARRAGSSRGGTRVLAVALLDHGHGVLTAIAMPFPNAGKLTPEKLDDFVQSVSDAVSGKTGEFDYAPEVVGGRYFRLESAAGGQLATFVLHASPVPPPPRPATDFGLVVPAGAELLSIQFQADARFSAAPKDVLAAAAATLKLGPDFAEASAGFGEAPRNLSVATLAVPVVVAALGLALLATAIAWLRKRGQPRAAP